MSFTFKVTGSSFYRVVSEMIEIEFKAKEADVEVGIDNSHIIDKEPYIIVTCQDDEKGEALMKRVEREVSRFLRLEG